MCGDARIMSDSDVIVIGPIGSTGGHLTVFKNKEGNTSATRGCFSGTLEEFEESVNRTNGDNEHAKIYRVAIELARTKLGSL